MYLQETHSTLEDEDLWKEELVGKEIIFNHGKKNARGVAIIIDKSLDYKIEKVFKDTDGRLIIIELNINGIVYIMRESGLKVYLLEMQ